MNKADISNNMGAVASSDAGEPKIDNLRLPYEDGVSPFAHIAEPEIALDQAFAMLKYMEVAWSLEGSLPNGEGLTVSDMNTGIHARALEGVSSLVALAAHGLALLRHARNGGC